MHESHCQLIRWSRWLQIISWRTLIIFLIGHLTKWTTRSYKHGIPILSFIRLLSNWSSAIWTLRVSLKCFFTFLHWDFKIAPIAFFFRFRSWISFPETLIRLKFTNTLIFFLFLHLFLLVFPWSRVSFVPISHYKAYFLLW